LQKLLASHPRIRSGEESHFFSLYVGPQLRAWKSQKTYHFNGGKGHAAGPPAYFREEEFVDILRNYLLELLKPVVNSLRSDELFLEKTPSHALYISEIKELLPESRFIHLLRDPRDVVASLMAASQTWGMTWAPTDAGSGVAMWLQHVRAVQAAASNLSAQEFYELSYETLWRCPGETLKGLAEFLEVTWTEDEIESAIETNQAEVMESGGTPIPVYGEVGARTGAIAKLPLGFVRKARPNAWKSDLSICDKIKIWRATRNYIEKTGYSWEMRDWFKWPERTI
jgi:hypothetical protein